MVSSWEKGLKMEKKGYSGQDMEEFYPDGWFLGEKVKDGVKSG